MTKELVCADCGTEQDEDSCGPGTSCKNCGGPRVAAIDVVAEVFGDNWRNAFQKKERLST